MFCNDGKLLPFLILILINETFVTLCFNELYQNFITEYAFVAHSLITCQCNTVTKESI